MPTIGGFIVDNLYMLRRIEDASLAGIAAKLPNLKMVVWMINDDEKCDALLRQVNRFGKYLPVWTLSSFVLFKYVWLPRDLFHVKHQVFIAETESAQSLAMRPA